jgi:hypothetical protein
MEDIRGGDERAGVKILIRKEWVTIHGRQGSKNHADHTKREDRQ